jgi:acyl transferase domain-containing protein/short-subunit dehydrogenase/acyl carrier protein
MDQSAPEGHLTSVKQALLALQAARKKIDALEKQQAEPIAIIGMGCRFPGDIGSPEDFWALLNSGKDTITTIPESRWDSQAYYSPSYDDAGKIITTQGSFFSKVQESDPEFFGISPREAKNMDPQQHLLLEVCWESLEHANIVPASLAGSRTGVFIGICNQDYSLLSMSRDKTEIDAYMTTGMAHSVASGRLSYILGLEGPCVAIDTACSSSLVSVHLACQSLRNLECDLAITGGVNLTLSPETSIDFSRNRMLSPDGKCKAFSSDANGFGRGEGCGLVVLKRLSDVDTEHDRVLALIRGSAVNQDGSSSGLTAPNGPSQQRVIQQALKNANVQAAQIDYIEAHGTGTSLGDPIEIGALAEVFSSTRTSAEPLRIGSVKTNVGHMEGAAGISGLLKVVLALQHKVLPAHLHCAEQNPHIPWNSLPFAITHQRQDWLTKNTTRMAGVSSFGFSGTNSHVILEEAPTSDQANSVPVTLGQRPFQILNISARSAMALNGQVSRFAQQLQHTPAEELAAFCLAASLHRTHFENRLSIVAESKDALLEKLNAFLTQPPQDLALNKKLNLNGQAPKVAWLFTGQGSQYPGMGKELFETEAVFREALEQCATYLDPILERSLLTLIFEDQTGALNQTLYTQPALFAVEYSLAQLWLSWGIKPDVVAGHSVGEYVAACVAGVFSLEDGLKLISTRARLMHQLQVPGGMMAVFASASEVERLLNKIETSGSIEIAGLNTFKETVVSGDLSALKDLRSMLADTDIKYRELTVSHAFHSALMEPMLDEFLSFAETIKFNPPRIPLLSNVDGALADQNIQTARYWRDHIRQPVQFTKITDHLINDNFNAVIEIGPQPILLGMISQHEGVQNRSLIPSLRKNKIAAQALAEGLSQLYQAGLAIDWLKVYGVKTAPFVDLPTYAFQRQRHWFNSSPITAAGESVQSFKLLELIKEGNTSKLRAHLEQRNQFDAKDEALLTKICQVLVDEYQQNNQQKIQALYQPVWQVQIGSNLTQKPAPEHRHTLVFASTTVGLPATALNGADTTNIYVVPGHSFTKKSEALWIIDETSPNDYAKVIQEVNQTITLTSVALVWPEGWDEKNFHSAFGEQILLNASYVSNALTQLNFAIPLWFLVNRSASLTQEHFSIPFASMLNGFARSLFLENPAIRGGVLEFDETGAQHVFDEITADTAEGQILLLGNKRYVSRLEPVEIVPFQKLQIAEDATYVITGGTGSLGLQAARFLASKHASEVILLGRNIPSESAQQAIQEIEALDTKVLFMPCDVSQATQVKQAFDFLLKNKRQIKGVIHAAGVATPILCQDLTPKALHNMFEAKVQGAWNLHEQTKELDLDFFVLYSSISSVLGTAQLAHYSAANSFLDGLATHRRSCNLPAISINWGPWQSGGLVQTTAGADKVLSSGFLSLAPSDALQYLEQALLLNRSQITVVNANWNQVKNTFSVHYEQPIFERLAPDTAETETVSAPLLLNQLHEMPAWNRSEALSDYISQQVCALLEISDRTTLDFRRGFFDFGMDSLMAVALRTRLEQQLGCKLVASTIFDFPSIEQLTKYLLSLLFTEVKTSQALESPVTQPSIKKVAVHTQENELSDAEIAALIEGELSSLNAKKDA